MELLTPDFYRVYSGTLSQGIFSEKAIKEQLGRPGFEHNIYDVDFSGRKVAVLLSFSQEKDCLTDKTITGLDSASIRSSQCAGIDIHNHWGRISLEKLKADKGITLVDSKPREVTTVSDIRYQERLDSFFKESSADEVVNPLFSETDRFDPKIMAAYGWEYSPPEYDTEKEAKLSWRYFVAKEYDQSAACELLLDDVANDAIKSYSQMGRSLINGFQSYEKFPDALVCENVGQSSRLSILVSGLKNVYTSSLLSINEQPRKAVVVKLAGYHDFLLTTLEHKDELNFKPFSDHDLLSYFRDTWQEHIEQIDLKEFVRNTLPTLGKILPALDKDYKVIVDCVEMISGTSHIMIEAFEAINISRETIKEKMDEFKSLYHELALIQKQIEFYKVAENNARRIIVSLGVDGMDDDVWLEYFTPAKLTEIQGLNLDVSDEDIFDCFKEWFVEFTFSEKEKANSRLKDLDRKLLVTKYKVNVQSVLEPMLCNLTGKLIDLKFSSDNESLRNYCDRLSFFTNEVMVLIALNEPDLNELCNDSLEPLDLAADLTAFDSGRAPH